MKLLSIYNNGNYQVKLYEDGTKVKLTRADDFDADFPDSIDIKITDYCDMLCPMCHEKSTPSGSHAELDAPFFATLRRGTELAIGGGNPLSHPRLVELLQWLKSRGIIANVTLHETHLLQNIELVEKLIEDKLIYGLGVSLSQRDPRTFCFQAAHNNVLFHLIIGMVSLAELRELYDKQVKVLLLGYKQVGRGIDYYSDTISRNIQELKEHFQEYRHAFQVLSFDNLALSQLDVRSAISPEEWDSIYMGEDGESTMYIDLVRQEYAVSSISYTRYPLLDSIDEMFSTVKECRHNN